MFNIGIAVGTATSVLQYHYLMRRTTKDEEELEKNLSDEPQ